jgi:hypothetical protein
MGAKRDQPQLFEKTHIAKIYWAPGLGYALPARCPDRPVNFIDIK